MTKDICIIDRLSPSDYAQSMLDYLGYHLPLQLVVICEGQHDKAFLKNLNKQFMHTPFGKLRKKSLFPCARDYWIPLPEEKEPDVYIHASELTEDELLNWLNKQVDGIYEVRSRAGWKISAANLADNKWVISILVCHQLIDGRGGLGILQQLSAGGNHLTANKHITFYDDVIDSKKYAKRLTLPFIAKTCTQLGSLITPRNPCNARVDTSLIMTFHKDHIDEVASTHGGASTQLSIALSANIANAVLGTQENQFLITPVKGDDPQSNSVKNATVDLRTLPSPITNLSTIKSLAKDAYSQSKTQAGLKKSWCLLSNVGLIPEEIEDVFPNIIHAFGRSPLWSNHDRFLRIFPGGLTFTTVYNDIITYTFITTQNMAKEKFAEIIDAQLNHFGLSPLQVIR